MTFEQIIGTIVGGAIGDGWGSAFEGGEPRSPALPPNPLVISDDTQLTLATCEAFIEHGAVEPATIAHSFVVWYRARRLRGLGASTLKALRDLDAGAHWALSGAKGDRSAGNGAAMRIAPIAFLLDPNVADQRQTLRDVCRITHHHDEAYIGALAVVIAVRLACGSDFTPSTLLADVAEHLPDSQVRDRILQLAGHGADVSPVEVARQHGSSAFVVESVPLALLAARAIGTRSFEGTVQRAIEAGGDTDTIGSITGQIAGAAVGAPGLPPRLVERLSDERSIVETAMAFGRVVLAR